LRRYIPTLLVAFGLLVVGAVVIVLWQTGGNLDPDSPQTVLLFIVGGTLGALAAVALLGALFGLFVNWLAHALSDERRAAKAPAPSVALPKPAPAPKKEAALPIPLYDDRSVAVFGVALAALVLGFLVVRTLAAGTPPGYPLDRLPDWSGALFELPGDLTVTQGIGLAVVAALALGGTIVVGVALAWLAAFLGRQTLKAETSVAQAGAGAAKAPAAKAPPSKGPVADKPAAFLYDNRSLFIFSVGVTVLVVGFLLVRALAADAPLGYTPLQSLSEPVGFQLPGERIEGWPSQIIPGPGDSPTAWQTAVLVVLVTVGGVSVVGVGLARLLQQFTSAEKAVARTQTPAWPAAQLQALETRMKEALARPFPPRLNWLDQLILLIFLALAALTAVWVLPGIGQVLSTDSTVEATQIAASWTPTPLPGPTPTLGPGPDVLVAALPPGDAAAGQAVTEARGCVGCHIAADPAAAAALTGPAWLAAQSKDGVGVSQHAAERWNAAGYTGRARTAQEYLYESITLPNAYVVPGYLANLMPQNYGELLTPQELADVIAYLAALQ